jgi:streptomycin 6-kinase
LADQDLIVPPAFARHTVEMFGEEGVAWLRDLPVLVADLARLWGLELGAPFELSYNYVCSARRSDGTEAVLKLGLSDEFPSQMNALRLYDGDGICRLLEADEGRDAMLLERIRPGEMLVNMVRTDDETATRIGATVMRRLWRPVPAGETFRPLSAWFRAFERHRAAYGGPGPIPAALLDHAEALARELLDSAPSTVLLHGDFHHYNVLSAEREPWLAIDPKGIVGDPGYEVGSFLRNPLLGGAHRQSQMMRRRLDIFAEELGYDRARLRDWGIAHAVLSACWSAEDEGHGWEGAIEAAQTLMEM